MNRGVERGEKSEMTGEERGGEGRMSSRRTSKCSPRRSIAGGESRGRHANFRTWDHKSVDGPAKHALIEMLVGRASWWPSSLRDAPCNHATVTSWVQIWPRTRTASHQLRFSLFIMSNIEKMMKRMKESFDF